MWTLNIVELLLDLKWPVLISITYYIRHVKIKKYTILNNIKLLKKYAYHLNSSKSTVSTLFEEHSKIEIRLNLGTNITLFLKS